MSAPERSHLTLPLRAREDLGRGYFVLRFDAAEPLPGRAGQFAMVRSERWGRAPLLPRPMSLLSAGREPAMLVKAVGEGTRRMASAEPGERFSLLAPLGRPWSALDEAPGARRTILVAGGVGVAPLLFLARELARGGAGASARASGSGDAAGASGGAGAGGPGASGDAAGASGGAGAGGPGASGDAGGLVALYGGRSAADLPLADELRRHAELRVATEDGSRGTTGRVTVLLERVLAEVAEAGERASARIYACGPHAMMAAVAALAAAAGVACEVSLEAPMACGYGVCLGCAVARSGAEGAGGYLYTCVEGPCVDAAQIDWQRSVW